MTFSTTNITHLTRFFYIICFGVLLSQVGCQDAGTGPRRVPCDEPTGPTLGQWQLLGLEHETITAIAIDPVNPEVIYAGSAFDFSAGVQGKLFKSKDCGETWETLLVGGSYRAILLDPLNPEIVYAIPGSMIKSTDSGATWKVMTNGIKLDLETRIQCLAIDPQNPNVLYAGTGGFFGGTLYKSMDGGNTWRDILQGDLDGDGVVSLAIDPKNTNIIYAGTAWRGLLLKSTDAGESWSVTGLGETGQLIDVVAVSPYASNVIYAGVRFEGLFSSNDAGETWKKETLPDSVRNCADLAFDPKNEFNVYAATGFGCYNKKGVNSFWLEMNEGFVYKSINVLKMSNNFSLYAGQSTFWEKGGGIYVRSIR